MRVSTTGLLLAAIFSSVAAPWTARATDLAYSTPTSAPEGHAVCSFAGSVVNPQSGNTLEVTLAPSLGEGSLTVALSNGSTGLAEAGTQAGCDIFPNSPSMFSLPLPTGAGTVDFSGVLDIHAHPGSDCGAAGLGTGTISAVVGGAPGNAPRLKNLKCDGDPSRANLELDVDAPGEGATGEVFPIAVQIRNHGPGAASGVMLKARLPRTAFLDAMKPTQGTCTSDGSSCDLGSIPLYGAAMVYFDLIPLKKGNLITQFGVLAENGGDVFDDKVKDKTPIMKGNSAILNVSVKCKGAAGTVTINPNGGGGMTTCTCPDPQDATRTTVQCIEIYNAMTTVTLTEAPTSGQFDRWTGDCTGTQATCTLTLDPAAAHPDKSAKAKFKP
ncbi:MAG: hypothetical protein HYZ50_04240 [Deltaproteobacteria bacterium]|nr:hypothetical protein [Deltaproteobacteria bacterium]